MLALGALWMSWLGAWLRRVELHAEAAPVVDRLGLQFSREGWGASVRARRGEGAAALELRWRRRFGEVRVHARFGTGRWRPAPREAVAEWVLSLEGTPTARG